MLRGLANLAVAAALIPTVRPTVLVNAGNAKPRAAVLALSRRAVLGSALPAATLATFPLAASAGFGSGSAAVTSTPQLRALTPDELLALDPLKLSQRLGSISLPRAKQIVLQLQQTVSGEDALDDLIKKLSEEAPSSALTLELQNLKAQLVQARKARALQAQVRERQLLLERLDAQPGWVVFGAATTASLISTSVMHPVDTFKTLKMGAAEDEDGVDSASLLSQLPSLYNGLPANLLKEGPPSALYLGVYEMAKSSLQGRTDVLLPELVIYLIAGALGELVGSVVRAPSEAAKTRVQSRLASSTGEAFTQLAAEPAQVLSQWGVSVLRDVPFGAIQLAIFESTKSFIVQSPDIEINVNTLIAEALLGGLGGLIGALVSAPADVLVTRLILQPEPEGDSKKLGALEMSKRIWDEAGPMGFLNGALARAGYWTPAIAIFLASFCRLRKAALDIGLG